MGTLSQTEKHYLDVSEEGLRTLSAEVDPIAGKLRALGYDESAAHLLQPSKSANANARFIAWQRKQLDYAIKRNKQLGRVVPVLWVGFLLILFNQAFPIFG
jgi:hypothetical protein